MGSNRFALYSRFLLSDDREATFIANIERNFLPNPKGTSLGSDGYRDRSIRSYSRLRIWYHYWQDNSRALRLSPAHTIYLKPNDKWQRVAAVRSIGFCIGYTDFPLD